MDFRIERFTDRSYYGEKKYCHISKKPGPKGMFTTFYIVENAECSICHKKDDCYTFSMYCNNYEPDDYSTYWAEDEVFLCQECLQGANKRMNVHQEKKKNMAQKIKSLKVDIGKNITCIMSNGKMFSGELVRVSEKDHDIFIRKPKNKKVTGIDLMEVEKIEVE